MEAWVEKYRPMRIIDIAGNPTAKKSLSDWIKAWNEGIPPKKAVLIHGPGGVGKTSLAVALSKELGYDYIELNASDIRSGSIINRIVGTAATQHTLVSKINKRIIILDEVDGIHGKSDYGGLKALKNWVKMTLHPIILIANDPWNLPQDFRSLTFMLLLKKVDKRTILKVLKEIQLKEDKSIDEKVLKILSVNANGDLRAAINDLQSLTEGKNNLTLNDIKNLHGRDSQIKIFESIRRIFKSNSCTKAREAVNESEEDPDLIMKWVVENLPREYSDPNDLALGYKNLSKADIYKGRILKRQAWILLKYSIDLMSAGVAMSKTKIYKAYTRYQFPETFILYSKSRKKRSILNSIADKIQGKKETINEKVHCSKKIAFKEFIPLIQLIMNQNHEKAVEIASELKLDLEEIKYLVENKDPIKIYEDSKKLTDQQIKNSWKTINQAFITEFNSI